MRCQPVRRNLTTGTILSKARMWSRTSASKWPKVSGPP